MKTERVRLPRKLNKTVLNGQLTEAGRLRPVGALAITLNLQPLHRVSMTLAESDLPMAIHDLVEVYNQNGSVGVYRVAKITNTYRKERKLELSHGLDVFSDSTFTSIEKFSGTVATFLQKVINAQTQTIGGVKYWQLGTCADTNPWNKDIKYDNLMECLTDLAKTEEDYMFTFDQSSFPWTLNFVARDSTVLSEFRLSRNMESCQVALDDADLCTRLHLSVTTETTEKVIDSSGVEHIAGIKTQEGYYTYNDTAAQAVWGIVSKTAGILKKDVPTEPMLAAWVDAYFSRHNTPSLQITISGEELNRLTRESIDELYIGRICRVALPDYASVFNERIVSVNYPDALRMPTKVKVNLANKRQTAEASFSEIKQKAGRAGGAAGSAKTKADNNETEQEKQKIRYDLQVVKDEKRFAVIATEEWYDDMWGTQETLIGHYDGKFEVTARQMTSAFSVTGVAVGEDGMPLTDPETGEYIFNGSGNSLSSQITQTASAIRSEVSNTAAGLRSSITEQANRISLVVEGTGANAHVKPASIIAAITNNNGRLSSSITIDADQVYIGNQTSTTVIAGKCALDDVTADYIGGKIATLSTLNGIAASFTGNVSCSGLLAGQVYVGSGGGYRNISNPVMSVVLTGPVDNVYTLTSTRSDGTYSSYPFSRATTLTGAWSSGKFTVNASPQGDSYWTEIVQGSATRDGNAYTVPIVASDSGSGGNTYATGRSVYVDASQVYTDGYDDGWDEARAKVVPPAQAASGEVTSFTFKAPSATKDEQQTYTFSIQKGATPSASGYASVALSGTVVGRISIGNWYTSGYNDGKPVSGTAGGRTSGVSALVHDFTITKGDGTTATLQINVSGIYATARQGYTYGTFTQATVTPQGNSDSVFVEASSGGYDYYQADSNATYYQAGTEESYYDGNGGEFTVQGETETVYPGNGTSGYLRGSTVTVTKQGSSVSVHTLGTVHYYVRHASSETPTTAWYTRQSSRPSSGQYNVEYQDGGSSTYYNAGSDVTYYKGDGSYVYGRGTAMTRYKAGTVTKHDRGNAVTVTPVGASVTVTPIKTSTKKHLLATTRYKAGTPDSSTYYTKS